MSGHRSDNDPTLAANSESDSESKESRDSGRRMRQPALAGQGSGLPSRAIGRSLEQTKWRWPLRFNMRVLTLHHDSETEAPGAGVRPAWLVRCDVI